jgi:hypothetical protein
MTLEEFESRVAQRYFTGGHCPPGTVPEGASLDELLTSKWAQQSMMRWTGGNASKRSCVMAASTT